MSLYAPFTTYQLSFPQVLEQEKKRNLSKEQHKTSTPHPDHAPGWNENLASASEAAIKVRNTIPFYCVQTLTFTPS